MIPGPVGAGGHQLPASWSLLPNGQRIRGANVCPKPLSPGPGGQYWDSFWGGAGATGVTDGAGGVGGWDWLGWVKPQIDKAKALGLNTIRIIGPAAFAIFTTSGITCTTPLTRTTGLANLTTVLDYCRSIGMYYYACGGDQSTPNRYGNNAYNPLYTDYLFQQELVVMANVLVNYQDIVVGFDICEESHPCDGTTVNPGVTWVQNVNSGAGRGANGASCNYNAQIKAITGWKIPLTYSALGSSEAGFQGNAAAQAIALASYQDIVDMHLFNYNPAADDLASHFWNQGSGTDVMKVVLSEFGGHVDAGVPTLQTRYAAFAAMHATIGKKGQRCSGMMCWAITDQDTANSNMWGIYDTSYVARGTLPTLMQGFAY